MNDSFTGITEIMCPYCEETHELEVQNRIVEALYKGVKVSYNEAYYLCDKTDSEFAPDVIHDRNLFNLHRSYAALTKSEAQNKP